MSAAEKELHALDSELASKAAALKSIRVDASRLAGEYTSATESLRAIDTGVAAVVAAARSALTELTRSHAAVLAAVFDHAMAVSKARAESRYADAASHQTVAPIAPRSAHKPGQPRPARCIRADDRQPTSDVVRQGPISWFRGEAIIPVHRVRPNDVRRLLGADGVFNDGQSATRRRRGNAIEFSTGWTDVAAHNGNKSLALQRKVGDTVTFTGAIPGTYRVAGTIEATGTRSSCESSDSTRRKGRSARDGPSRIVLALQS